jgi:glutaredoxin-like YruB-family protein
MKIIRITLYSTRNCPYCRQARQYLKSKGVRFQEFDIQKNIRAKKTLAGLGARAVPVIMVGDARVDGFDRKRLDALLKRIMTT